MSNPFDQFDAPAAEGGNPFDQFDAPAAKKLPSKGILSDVGGAFVEGAKSAGRAIAGTANIYAGDESALVEKAQAQESAQAQKPAALTAFNQAVTERVKPLGDDPGLLDSVKAIGGAVVDQPKGAGLAVVEQLPNAAPAIAGGMAGMKAGAALGTAIMPGVGTTIGAIGGGLAGMFLGNTAIETGYKGIEAAQDGAVTQDEMSRVKKEGAVKAGVITGVDALTLGLSKAVTNIPARAVESATRNALTKAGVNVADEAAVLAARQSPEISAAVRAAQESAFASANTLGKRAAAGGAALGLETVGEGLGEYLGELAATGKANVADAVLEAMMSLGQSGAEVAWGAARNKKAEQGGMWDTAEAKFQPPPPTLVTEPEPLQQRIDALMGIDTGAMSDKERTQYEKDLTAAFLEPVGVTQDEHGLEIPFTMADYLNAQVRAEDSVRARPLKQNAADQSGNRLQQLADEETQQQPDIPGYVAPEIPVVGTLSAMANMAIQSGAHKQNQMQQAMQAAVASQKTNNEGTANAAQAKPLAQEATRTNDAQAGLASSAAQAASQGTGVAAPAAFSASVPALNAGNSVNLPATSISSLQDQLDKTEPFSEQSQLLTERLQLAVTDDAKSAIGAGEMPVYKVTDHVSVAIHPSAQKEGMIQVTRYTKDGVIGDSQYNSIDEAVRFEGLTHKPRIPSNEAIAHIENSIAAEAEYQKRKNEQQAGAGLPASTAGGSRPAPVANQEPVKNQSEQPLDMVPAADAVSQPKTDAAPEAKQDNAPVSTLQPDPALQNRDRGRAASVNQMQSIARNPDYMRLGPSRTPDSGAPMVFAVGGDTNKIAPSSFGANDIAVMSDGQRVPFRYAVVDASSVEPSNFADGATNPAFASNAPGTIKALNNGRTAGVRAAHEGSKAANYTAELLADQAHGVSPEAIRNTPNPMLVRVYAEQANTGDMAAKSQGQGLGMSASERATQDAELMTADVLDKFAPGDIASAGNRDFVRAFVGKLAENELADMMDATGNLSQDGRRRIEAALLTAAYGKSDLVQELFESTDTDIKAIGNALKVMSGQWAAMRQAAKEGSIDPATDMTANLIEAVNIVRRSRAEGSSIAELAGQGDLMGGNYLSELSEGFLRIFYKGKNYDRARGGDKVISALQEIVTSAMNTKADAGLFGDSFKATPKQIVESARSKIDEENKPASQSSLFGANGQATAVSQGNNGEGAAQSGEVGSRPVGTGRGEETGKQAEPVAKAAEQAPAVDAKEPWQMTRKEWYDAKNNDRAETFGSSGKRNGAAETAARIERKARLNYGVAENGEPVDHRQVIEKAIADGKQIPDEVLADYPDLKESGIALLSPSLGRVDANKVDIAVASKVVADLLSGWRNAPDSRVVATFDDLPAAVRKEIEDQGEKTARGVFHGDTFYLIADEHASANEIEETIFHEVWAHYGLRSMLGANTTRELAGVFDQISASGIMGVNGKDAFRAFARRNGFNTAQTESMLRKAEAFDPRFTEAMKKRILVEELIAKVQEKGDNPSLKRKAQEIIGAIREWLRKVGFSGLMKYSDADLMRLVQKARDTVKYGKRGSSGKGDVPSVLMTAWHGSPHDHDKFDSSKIGTGEGAQAYGYGHYFAGAKDVAEWYRRKLSGADNSSITFNGKQYGDSDAANRKLTNDVKKWAEETGRDPERIDVALEYLAGMAGDLGSARQLAAKEGLGISHWIYGTLNDLSEHLYPSPNGRLYQVELAPTADEYLDWDKPLSEQSEFVRNALTDKSHFIGEYLSDTLEIAKNNGVDFNERGDTLYKIVSDQYGSDKAASDYLHSIGIRGIRYLDGSSRSAGEGNSNYVIFNDADVSITAKYNKASKDKLTPADKAIYGMAAEGKSAAEVLKFIASASRSPFNRQVAKLLLKTGIAPSVTVGDGKGWKMNAGEGNKYAAGYNPKTDTISLFRPASSERNMLHELIHAATLKALSKKGMAAAQMKALYQHVKKSGKLKGMYGMSDVDEFIAEAFSNPKFQAMLKQVSAAPVGGKLSSAWDWFIRVVRGILGLKQGQDNALSQALDIGIGVMRENMRLNEGTGDVRYNAAPGKINQTDTEAFKRWFGDSKVVDSDGKPLVVYHGTPNNFNVFLGRHRNSANFGAEIGATWFTPDEPMAQGYSGGKKPMAVYLTMKNPYIHDADGGFWMFENDRAIKAARAGGHDGVIIKNVSDTSAGQSDRLIDTYVTFDPTQIKSAIGNNGDFDATNPDIRYNVADEGWSVSEQAKETVMRLAGRPMLDPSDPFAAENARLREQDQSLWSKAKKQLRRYLAPGGLLPQSVFAEKIKRDSEFQAVEFDVRHLIGGLEHAVKADFGIAFDKLSKEQMRPITEALAGNVPASLPEATKTAAVAMRQYIDGMSTEYLKIIQQKIDAKMLKALESGKDSDKAQAINEIELFEKIKGNIGRYVHRSYQAFDDPKWFEKVPAHVLNASRLYLKQGYMEAGENDAKASQMAEVTLHEILKNGTAYDSMESFIAESKLGAKDLSVLMRRKEVPAQIRALLGEYPDARLNFTKSATKMGRLIWNTRFLDRVRDMGMGSFFFEGKDRPANATTQIAADGSEVYAPLNGLWTFPEIAQSFKDALGKEQMSDLYRAIVRFNGLVKYGKTVLAPTTAMRNWQSAMFFSLANGHFDLTQMKKSISAFREQVSQKATGQDLKYLRHLKQLGVVYDTPYAGEMARLMEDARMEELLSSDKGDAVRWFRKANQLAQGFYTFGDDFWKIIGFENEKAGLMKAGLSLQEAETEAAKRIRDTYPTYSMVGRGVQWLSRFPLAGTFVSFPAEIIRTSGNMLRTVAADLKSDNPKLRELGMKRAAGMVFVSAAFYSLAALSMAMAGVGDDEDEAIRDLAPEWQKNSTFLYLGRDEKGNLRYFDMSFLDPYGYWKRPITAMLRNQPWEDSLASGLRGMLEPFIGADIAAKAIFEAVANQKENGGKVYKEKDGAINQTIDVADHLRKALQPGVVGNVERLVKAAGDVRKSSGQPYSMEDELVALVGWRATTIDPKTALYYRSFEFTDAVAEARKTITETLRDANEITPEDIADAKARAQAKQEQAFKEMHRLVSAAESAGMSKMQIVQTLRLSNISQANIGSLMRGETPDVSITPQLAARAVRQASQMRGPEYAAEVFDRYRQARAN